MNPAGPRILVIRRRYLGDIVLLGSFLRNLRLHWPTARVSVLVESSYAGVPALNPDIDEILLFPKTVGAWLGMIPRLRRARFTHVFDFDNRDKTALLTRITGAPERITARHGEPVSFPRLYTATESLPRLGSYHIVDFYHHALGKAGVPVATRECRLVPKPEDLKFADELLAQLGVEKQKPKILVHPGSRSAWRVWPPENFAAVSDRMQEELGAAVAIIAGPGEQATVDEIARRVKRPVVRIGQSLTVPQLAALFTRFDAMLCHDSGPMHLAASVGTRVVALFGSQPVNAWRPVGEGHALLQAPLPCVNCVAPDRCTPEDSYHNYCVRNITPDGVLAAINGILSSPDRRQAAGR